MSIIMGFMIGFEHKGGIFHARHQAAQSRLRVVGGMKRQMEGIRRCQDGVQSVSFEGSMENCFKDSGRSNRIQLTGLTK